MGAIFTSLERTLAAGVILVFLIVIAAGLLTGHWVVREPGYGLFFMRWLHIMSGVMWIGLLWYLNFVQVPTMPKIQPVETRTAITKFIAPNVLWWFRYGALATVITGLLLAYMQPGNFYGEYLINALTLHKPHYPIGIGMWMALVMAFNVWFIIWPNQKKILGIVEASAEEKAKAAPIALYASRFNTMFSLGMLYCMAAESHSGLL